MFGLVWRSGQGEKEEEGRSGESLNSFSNDYSADEGLPLTIGVMLSV